MARLIPAFVDETTPPGEREVFQMLAAGPDNWTIVHSLDLAPWNRRRRTEIDFVAVVPDSGILCIEVKSHRDISFENGRWHPVTITRSPFKQALDGRYALARRLPDLLSFAHRVPIVHCCIFPQSDFTISPNLSVLPDELIDARALHAIRGGSALCGDLRARMRRMIAEDPDLQPMREPLTEPEVAQILHCLVPVQRRHPEAHEEIVLREREIERLLRDQQRPVLQLWELNRRVLVSGGAGTGKTLIALELARRAAQKGQRVALLCFNQLVGRWMEAQIQSRRPVFPNLIVGRVYQMVSEMAGIVVPSNPPNDYWEHVFPELVEERLTDPDFHATSTFDSLVLDEAQDILCRPRIWHCLLQLVSGGADRGRFVLLGDFEHQVLGHREALSRSLTEITSHGTCTQWHLSENCRNYRIIGETAVRMSGFDTPVYTGYLRKGGSQADLAVAMYETDAEQRSVLVSWLRELRAAAFHDRDITLLSFCEPSRSVAARLTEPDLRIMPASVPAHSMTYTSVHAFKGMENKVTILTDLVVDDREFHRDVFYTAMTRSTGAVRVLCHRSSSETLMKWIREGGHA